MTQKGRCRLEPGTLRGPQPLPGAQSDTYKITVASTLVEPSSRWTAVTGTSQRDLYCF